MISLIMKNFMNGVLKCQKNNFIFISEHNMPFDKFECIWSKDIRETVKQSNENIRTERLFKVR